MPYRLRYHPEVRRSDIPKLSKTTRDRVKRAIEERLTTEPERYSVPLSRTLKGYRKLRVGEYRIVLSVADDVVTILAIRHRNDVYDRARSRGD